MRINSLEKAYDELIAKKHKLEQELSDLNDQKAQKEKEALAAADAGDLGQYKSIKSEVDNIDACIFVTSTQLRKYESCALDEDTVVKAWNKYADDYGKKFDKMVSDYEKARHALYLQYIQIIELQNDALKMRERCGFLMGVQPLPDQFKNGDDHYKNLKMRTLSTSCNPSNLILKTTTDLEFFSKYGEIDQDKAAYITGILNSKQSR